MKILLVSLFVFFNLSNSLLAKTILISDIDDTIKMTGVLNNKISVGFEGIFGKREFSGMSELYNEYDHNDVAIYYVSGSPQMIDCRIENFLTKRNFPDADQRFLKDKISSDTYKFKMNTIRNILSKYPSSTAILIGDDTEHDPRVYNDISYEFPGRVEAIYIRTITNSKLPSNPLMKSFFTSVEIAANELLKENLNYTGLESVVSAFVNQTKNSGMQLKRFYCPKGGLDAIKDLILKYQSTGRYPVVELLMRTQNKIIKVCKSRLEN